MATPPRLALAAIAGALALAAAWALLPAGDARAQEEGPLTVTSTLPEWAAPGTRVRVKGRTSPDTPVALRIGTRVRVRGTSGPNGGFVLEARAPRDRGRYGVAVLSNGTVTPVGPLIVRPVVLAAVGDVTFGDGPGAAIAQHGPRWPWDSVAPVLRGADLAVANLEGAVSRRGSPWPGKRWTFRGPPRALRAAAGHAGLDVVSVANNHSLDFGRTAFLDTLANARRFGLRAVGGGPTIDRARRPAVLVRGGLRVAFVGFSDVRPLGFDATGTAPGTVPAFPDVIREDVRAARRRADVVVAYFHWGEERTSRPNARQRSLAQTALGAGATVVLGAHPHVLQPIERRPHRRLVAWSLGNFVFAAGSPGTERTGILLVRLGARGVVGHRLRRATISWVQPRLDR